MELEKYLLMSNWDCISSLARFRCLNNKLAIEEGRHNAINLENNVNFVIMSQDIFNPEMQLLTVPLITI